MLESALRAAALGLNAHGQAISVIGDNISNANTTAFKTSRAEFADLMAAAPDDTTAETVTAGGDGVAVSRVRVLQDFGAIEPTGRELDVGISGGGFFVVGDTKSPQFTRAGQFEINSAGLLVTSAGEPVLGYSGTSTTTLGTINMYNVKTAGAASTKIQVYGNVDAGADVTTVPQNVASFKDLNDSQSYSSTQEVYDSLGQRHEIRISFFKTASNTWTVQGYVDGGDVTGGTEGTPVSIGPAATLKFGTDGVIADADKAQASITAAIPYGNGAAAGNFTIDLGSFTQYAGGSQVNNVTQDGQGAGNVNKYEFGSDGKIFAVMDTGVRSQVGTIPLALFKNVDGLERSGSGTFTMTSAAGDMELGSAGVGLRGTLEGAALERSTVDIADQFVNLVIFQRGYQANSQVLSATNETLQSTIQLIR